MSSSNRMIVAILVIAALALGFWILLLSPKREEADELGSRVSQLQTSLAEAQSEVSTAESARRAFPADYHQLVVLGQAVPASDETSSLLVELSHIAAASKVEFEGIQLNGSGETASLESTEPTPPATPESPAASSSPEAVQADAAIPPTEAAASLLPLGATIGPAGLGVMPYTLTFKGSFFHIADFMQGIDALIHTQANGVGVDGRLITLDGFALTEDSEHGFPYLDASFNVTTYLTPPSQGVTAGATPAAPSPSAPTPAAETGSPESSSETVAAR